MDDSAHDSTLIFLPVIQEVTRILSPRSTSWSILEFKKWCGRVRKGHMQFYMPWSIGMTPGRAGNIWFSCSFLQIHGWACQGSQDKSGRRVYHFPEHSPSLCGARRFLVPFFVISAVFLFFPRDLSIISLVANAPGEIRDVSMVTLHPSTVTDVHLLQVSSHTLMWEESQSAAGVTLLSPPKPTQKFLGWKYQPSTKAKVSYSSYSL